MTLIESAGYSEAPGGLVAVPIAPGETIFDGALVAIDNSGGANDGRAINWRSIVSTVRDSHFFLGVAQVTETVGVTKAQGEAKTGSTPGVELIHVDISGVILRKITVSGTTVAIGFGVGDQVFALDENTFTATPPTLPTDRAAVGFITKVTSVPDDVDIQLFTPGEFRAFQDI